jgi:hypothetical protein
MCSMAIKTRLSRRFCALCRLPDLIDRALISEFNCLTERQKMFFFMKIEFDFCCSLCCIKFDSLNIKLSNVKKFPTYIPTC